MTVKTKKDFFIKVRVTEEEKILIENKAEENDLSVSDLIRTLTLNYNVRYNQQQKEFIRHFARASSNINQIARSVNIFKHDINKVRLILYLAKIEEELKGLKQCI